MTTNVPTVDFGDAGFIAPAESAVLAGRMADYQAAFGGALNPAVETPQGQMASSDASVIAACNALFLLITNQVDPSYSSGRMQDAIARIYFLERKSALPTVVAALCTGAAGTIIPTGALAQAADGNIYSCTGGGTIPSGGTITLQFACINTGPVECSASTLTTIYRAVPGWDTINNPSPGAAGRLVENRADFERRRSESVALNSVGMLPSIRASVLNVPDILDCYVTENDTASPVTKGGVTIPANSLYVAAAGGLDADIARAIWIKKAPGCAYYGSTTVTVLDDNSGYSVPLPSYTVKFTRAADLTCAFAVTLAAGTDVPSDAVAQVQNAILAAFNGTDGSQRARIGATVYALRFVGAIQALGSWVRIVSITVNTAADITANINQIPVTSAGDISVTIS
jgi:uncharacterized phage protein gp47/JayE